MLNNHSTVPTLRPNGSALTFSSGVGMYGGGASLTQNSIGNFEKKNFWVTEKDQHLLQATHHNINNSSILTLNEKSY